MKQSYRRRIFISDCEGPISRNDNAFELASHFIPDGSRLFTLISRYDDVLADVVKRKGYKAGDTLKLILPFLKAYRVTNQAMADYSSKNMLLVFGAKEMLRFVQKFMPSFIVSTSYEQYMRLLCDLADFPFENVHCTRLDLDKYKTNQEEVAQIQRLREEMVSMPIPEIPKGAKSLSELPKEHQNSIRRLDQIFWRELAQMNVGTMLREVNPVGGDEKAEAVWRIVALSGNRLRNVMYVGDSITDVSVFRLVREEGGLTISFNGNSFAVREAEVAVLSENAIVTAVLANVFSKFGKVQVLNLIKEWKSSMIKKIGLYQPLKEDFFKTYGKKLPRVELINSQSMEKLMHESTAFRKTVRGEAIGKLG